MSPDPADVQALFARHYFYFAALATLGVFQIAVSIGGYSGLWLLPGRMLTRITGVVLIAAGVALFFLLPLWVEGPWAAGSVEADSSTRLWGKADWSDLGAARNVNDVDGGLSGTGQATWFPLSALIAVIVSIGAGTLNRKLFPARMSLEPPSLRTDEDGLNLMASESYWSSLIKSWHTFRMNIRVESAVLLQRADRWSIAVQIWKRWRE